MSTIEELQQQIITVQLGIQGESGDITPELTVLRDDVVAARDETVDARDTTVATITDATAEAITLATIDANNAANSANLAAQSAASLYYTTVALMKADLAHAANTPALVTNDNYIAGKNTYTITTNFVAGDTVTYNGVTFTAVSSGATGSQFNIGATTAITATNLATALNTNNVINPLYTAVANASIITITDTVLGGGNTPPNMTKTGTGVITNGTATESVSNGLWTKQGASGAGSWKKSTYYPLAISNEKLGTILSGTLTINSIAYTATISSNAIVQTQNGLSYSSIPLQTIDWSATPNPAYSRYIAIIPSTKVLAMYAVGDALPSSAVILGILYGSKMYLCPTMQPFVINGVVNGGWGESVPIEQSTILNGTLAINATGYSVTISASSIVYGKSGGVSNISAQTYNWSAEANPSYARYICIKVSTKELKVYDAITMGTIKEKHYLIGLLNGTKICICDNKIPITVNGIANGGWGLTNYMQSGAILNGSLAINTNAYTVSLTSLPANQSSITGENGIVSNVNDQTVDWSGTANPSYIRYIGIRALTKVLTVYASGDLANIADTVYLIGVLNGTKFYQCSNLLAVSVNGITNGGAGEITPVEPASLLDGTLTVNGVAKTVAISASSIVYSGSNKVSGILAQTVDWSGTANPDYAQYICIKVSGKTLVSINAADLSTIKDKHLLLGIYYNNKIYQCINPLPISVNGVLNGGNGLPDVSTWIGKKYVSYGDSLTHSGVWQALIAARLGLIHTNMGISSSTIFDYSTNAIPMCDDSRIDAIPLDTDVITIWGGANDWAYGVGITDINDTSKSTFYGAYKYIIERIQSRIPNCRIILMTPGFAFFRDGSNPLSGGKTTENYGTAVKAIAAKYNLPVIDVHKEMGINIQNALNFMLDEPCTVHLNTVGYKRLAGIVKGAMDRLETF